MPEPRVPVPIGAGPKRPAAIVAISTPVAVHPFVAFPPSEAAPPQPGRIPSECGEAWNLRRRFRVPAP